jgi:large subunit ribosomal protein L31
MKKNLHPNWNNNATVTCACGNSFTTGSMSDNIQVDICSACHPFFTGEMKFVDTQGRVDKFMQKMAKAKAKQAAAAGRSPKKQNDKQEDQKSYKQLLQEQRSNLKQAA